MAPEDVAELTGMALTELQTKLEPPPQTKSP